MPEVTRRGLFSVLAGAAAAAIAFDPERALWVPGARKVFIPAPTVTPSALAALDRYGCPPWPPVYFEWRFDEYVRVLDAANAIDRLILDRVEALERDPAYRARQDARFTWRVDHPQT